MEKEIEDFEAGGGRRRRDASQSNLCCVDAVILQQLVSLGKEHVNSRCQPSMGNPLNISASAATSHSGAPNGQSTAEDFWEEEHKKPAKRVYGPPAPGRRNQGIPAAFIFDLALLKKNGGGKASEMSSVCQEEERRTEAGSQQQEETVQQQKRDLGRHVEMG